MRGLMFTQRIEVRLNQILAIANLNRVTETIRQLFKKRNDLPQEFGGSGSARAEFKYQARDLRSMGLQGFEKQGSKRIRI